MRTCFKCIGETAMLESVVCLQCHQEIEEAGLSEIIKEELAICLLENIADMNRVFEGSRKFVQNAARLESGESSLYHQFTASFFRLSHTITYLKREVKHIFRDDSDLDKLIEVNSEGIREIDNLGKILDQWNKTYPPLTVRDNVRKGV